MMGMGEEKYSHDHQRDLQKGVEAETSGRCQEDREYSILSKNLREIELKILAARSYLSNPQYFQNKTE